MLDKNNFQTPREADSNQLVIKLAEQVMAHIHGTGKLDDLGGGKSKTVFHKWFAQEQSSSSDYYNAIEYREYLCRRIWSARETDDDCKLVLNALFDQNEQLKHDFILLRSEIAKHFPKIEHGQEISYQQLNRFKNNALREISVTSQ